MRSSFQMFLWILIGVYLLDRITPGPYLIPLIEDKDLNVIDGAYIRQAFRVLSEDDYKGAYLHNSLAGSFAEKLI